MKTRIHDNHECKGDSKLKLFGGSIRLARYKTKAEEETEKIAKYYQERSQFCCLICGIYLEINERNEKNLCSICIGKLKIKESKK